jgi:hypothetical protein
MSLTFGQDLLPPSLGRHATPAGDHLQVEEAIVLPSHCGRATKLTVVLGVLTKSKAAHSSPPQPPRKAALVWDCQQTTSSHSQPSELVQRKSVTTTTSGELRRYMSEGAIGCVHYLDGCTQRQQLNGNRSGAPGAPGLAGFETRENVTAGSKWVQPISSSARSNHSPSPL